MNTTKRFKTPRDWSVWKEWAAVRMTQPELPDQLRRWLAGNDLPLDDASVEPQDWILQAMPLGFGRENSLAGLTSAIASLMRNGGSLTSPQEIYGLLQLAAALAQPAALASALDEFLDSTNLRNLEHRRLRLTIVARYALRWNQTDDRWFANIWVPLVCGEEPSRKWGIEGTPLDGLDGITAMPLDLSALGWALVEIARHWENDEDRNAKRDQMWERVKSGNPAIDSDLLWRALTQHSAPEWLLETWCEPVIAGVQHYSGWSREKSASHVKERVEETILRNPAAGGKGCLFLAGAAMHDVPKSPGYAGTQLDVYESMLAKI